MKLTYGGQTIDLFDKYEPNQVLLSLSGGLDSAALFFLLCRYFPRMHIVPYTGKDLNAPFDALCAQDITDWMKNRFPEVEIYDREEFEFDHHDPYWHQRAVDGWEDSFVLVNGVKTPRCNHINGLTKMLMIHHFTEKLKKSYPEALQMAAQTSNPPVEEMKELGFYDLAERRRDAPNSDKQAWMTSLYQPFIHVDKKFIAGIYKEHELDELFHLTGSCIGTSDQTDYFTKECRQCFWCHEKKWAFNLKWD